MSDYFQVKLCKVLNPQGSAIKEWITDNPKYRFSNIFCYIYQSGYLINYKLQNLLLFTHELLLQIIYKLPILSKKDIE